MPYEKILLIEDDEKTRELYKDILLSGGYEVETAVNGQDGLNKATSVDYSVILLDIMMPQSDGLQFLTSFRNINKGSKIVVFTNLSQASVIEETKKLGADDFIVKSDMDPENLLLRIKNML